MKGKKYWFKPKRFWGWFAAYYPVSEEGWIITSLAAVLLIWTFISSDSKSRSASDTLLSFAPWAILIGIIFDIITRETGEYPSWWKKWKKK